MKFQVSKFQYHKFYLFDYITLRKFILLSEPGPPSRPAVPQRLIVVPDPPQPNRYR